MARLLQQLCALVYTVVLVSSYPTDTNKSRDRRQLYNTYKSPMYVEDEDLRLMKEAWDSPVSIGFFVNPKGDGGSPDADITRTVRNKISEPVDGSGAGPEHKRDEIVKPTAPVSNIQQASITGEVKSKIENEDPGDKRKVRSRVTCEGQKEWVQCDGPYELIKIQDAFWGRDDTSTCVKSDIAHGLKTGEKCVKDGENTVRKVREACDNENVCEIVASNIYFDQTDCDDVYKFLRLKWQCVPSESRIKEIVN